MGKIYFDKDKKLVVETSKGIIKSDGTQTAEINWDEEFVADSDFVLDLLAAINNTPSIIFKEFIPLDNVIYSIIRIGDREYNDFVKSLLKNRDKEISSLNNEIRNLRKAINEHNFNRKLFWKPIKVDWNGYT